QIAEAAVDQLHLRRLVCLGELDDDHRLWLIRKAPREGERLWFGVAHHRRLTSIVTAVIDDEVLPRAKSTFDQLSEPVSQQPSIGQALPNPTARCLYLPSEINGFRHLDAEQWHAGQSSADSCELARG